jgi:uncharacterized damage-inducible protein DinB
MTKFCTTVLALALVWAAGASRASAQDNMKGMQGMSHGEHMGKMGFDYKATVLDDIKDTETKFLGLAKAIPADKYTWRPEQGVRSVSEVFLHVASAAYGMPGFIGAAPDPGFNRQGFETSTTDKDKVIEQINKSFAHLESAVENEPQADLGKETKIFGGHESTHGAVLFMIITDLHEHLGQMIAYARMNKVVPPWTAARMASMHKSSM